MLTKITGTGSGTAPVVNLTFPFIDTAHVKAHVGGAPATLNWTGASQVTFASAVPNGVSWEVYRDTPADALVDFTDGAVLTSADLEKSQTQALYRLEELTDSLVPLAVSSADSLGYARDGSHPAGSVGDKINRLAVDPRDAPWGAKGDGTTNDLVALQTAMNFAFAAGLPVDGGDAIYAISGNLTFTGLSRPWIRALRLKQLSPVNGRVTLGFSSSQSIRVDKLEVNVGTAATVGDMNSTFGFQIDGGSNHQVRNVDVHGDGQNSLIAIWNTSHSAYDDLTAHTATFDNAAATDDVMQGIWLNGNADVTLTNPLVYDLTGNALYPNMSSVNTVYPNLRTRGIVLTNNDRTSIIEPKVRNVDQAIDITGSDGNRHCTVIGGHSYQCGSVGVKLANSAVGCKVVGHHAENIGMYGFMANGPAEAALPYKTQDCDFIGCTAVNIGYIDIQYANKAGFIIRLGDYDLDYPKGIRFIGCSALDNQATPTMKYGYYNEIAYDPTAKKPNEVIGSSKSQGHTIQAQAGFHTYIARVKGSGNQSLADTGDAPITWDSESAPSEDTLAMHSTSSNAERIVVPIAGRYQVKSKLTFAANATGYRRVRLYKNGTTLLATNACAAVNGEVTTCSLNETVDLVAGDYVQVNGVQNSGGALNVDKTMSFLELRLEQPL
jgi:hypothetical protein